MSKYTDIGVEKHGHVGLIEIRKPPLNFFDVSLINQIADALEEFDKDIEIRASVLAAQGKAFCAGADFSDPKRQEQEASAQNDPAANLPINHLYVQAVRRQGATENESGGRREHEREKERRGGEAPCAHAVDPHRLRHDSHARASSARAPAWRHAPPRARTSSIRRR